MRITDIFLAFPKLVLALALVSALGPGIENAIIAIAITSWPPYARIARAETLTIRNSDFISAVRLQGAGRLRIIWSHIMPLCTSSLIRSEEHTSELQSLMRNSYAVFCLKKQNQTTQTTITTFINSSGMKIRKTQEHSRVRQTYQLTTSQ